MSFKLNKFYLVLTSILFAIEVSIAVYVKTGFIRNTLGDFLVTILLFCVFKSFLKVDSVKLGAFVLAFAFLIEFLQLLNILEYLNIENTLVRIILGTTFHISDLIAYTLGMLAIVIIDTKLRKNKNTLLSS